MISASVAASLNCSKSGKYRRMGSIVVTCAARDSAGAAGQPLSVFPRACTGAPGVALRLWFGHPGARAMPFEITTTRTFSAAHQLRLPDGSIEPLHGHNWRVKVT